VELKGDNNTNLFMQRGITLAFWEFIILEGLFLLAAGMTFMWGVRGALAATGILSIIAWYTQPISFWKWEIALLFGVSLAIAILMLLVRKAGKSEVIAGMAGGLASLVVFGAFLTPFLAIFAWGLIVGTGLIPKLKIKQVIWGIAPMVWRVVMGIGWIIVGNILL
jgi:signal transduction histidine kinase